MEKIEKKNSILKFKNWSYHQREMEKIEKKFNFEI
jgi:hypothetical protein